MYMFQIRIFLKFDDNYMQIYAGYKLRSPLDIFDKLCIITSHYTEIAFT